MTALPDWMHPPREEGWLAEDLDRLREAPRHTELIDGVLVFLLWPQRSWHDRLVTSLTTTFMAAAPAGFEIGREMTIRLDKYNQLEPDLLVTTGPYDPDRTWYAPEEVRLVVEVDSPESAYRNHTVKLRKYAKAGIPHYWCIEDEDGAPAAHVYELDQPTGVYAPAGIFRHTLERPVPFEIRLDLDKLTPPRGD